ncbi:MAG: SDR family NAD(P)-dependent oxidoreductase [Ruthenibacterium lactatiformans]
MFLTQAVAKQMIRQAPLDGRKGVIVNVSSCSSVVSSVNRGEYCVSKAGVSMLTTLYADRLAQEGILVHEVRQGVIATDMTRAPCRTDVDKDDRGRNVSPSPAGALRRMWPMP